MGDLRLSEGRGRALASLVLLTAFGCRSGAPGFVPKTRQGAECIARCAAVAAVCRGGCPTPSITFDPAAGFWGNFAASAAGGTRSGLCRGMCAASEETCLKPCRSLDSLASPRGRRGRPTGPEARGWTEVRRFAGLHGVSTSTRAEVLRRFAERLSPEAPEQPEAIRLRDQLAALARAEQDCSAGQTPSACRDLGYHLVRGEFVAANAARALALFARACADGDGPACTATGVVLTDGSTIADDLVIAADAYETGCSLGDLDGCVRLGVAEIDGRGRTPDLMSGARRVATACRRGSGHGCYLAGRLSLEGRPGPSRPERAAAWYHEACRLRSAAGCHALGRLHASGQGVRRSAATAVELYRQACSDSHVDGCVDLARALATGVGVAPDPGESRRLYDWSCRVGHTVACAEARALPHGRRAGKTTMVPSAGDAPSCRPAIQDFIDGWFEGWEDETIVRLRSGQIWVQDDFTFEYVSKESPSVVVFESEDGCRMKVEGSSQAVRVERLR
jgi:TPR repeat protein